MCLAIIFLQTFRNSSSDLPESEDSKSEIALKLIWHTCHPYMHRFERLERLYKADSLLGCVNLPFWLHRLRNPVTRNRTRDHLIAALIYSQMLCQLSYDRLATSDFASTIIFCSHLSKQKSRNRNWNCSARCLKVYFCHLSINDKDNTQLYNIDTPDQLTLTHKHHIRILLRYTELSDK